MISWSLRDRPRPLLWSCGGLTWRIVIFILHWNSNDKLIISGIAIRNLMWTKIRQLTCNWIRRSHDSCQIVTFSLLFQWNMNDLYYVWIFWCARIFDFRLFFNTKSIIFKYSETIHRVRRRPWTPPNPLGGVGNLRPTIIYIYIYIYIFIFLSESKIFRYGLNNKIIILPETNIGIIYIQEEYEIWILKILFPSYEGNPHIIFCYGILVRILIWIILIRALLSERNLRHYIKSKIWIVMRSIFANINKIWAE